MEFRFVRADGEVRWVTARAAAVKDPQGIMTGFVGTVEDMTERRATEEQLRLIRSAVEHTGRAVMVAQFGQDEGSASSLVYVNPAFTRMTGFEPSEVLGRPIREFHEPLRNIGTAGAQLRAGTEQTLEAEMIRKDGSRFTAEGVISPILDASGTFSHVVVILRDITDIQAIEQRLRENLEELRRTDASRRATLAQIVEGQEQELERMAEGIEDSSIQQMTAVRIRMETLRRNLSDPGSSERSRSSRDRSRRRLGSCAASCPSCARASSRRRGSAARSASTSGTRPTCAPRSWARSARIRTSSRRRRPSASCRRRWHRPSRTAPPDG